MEGLKRLKRRMPRMGTWETLRASLPRHRVAKQKRPEDVKMLAICLIGLFLAVQRIQLQVLACLADLIVFKPTAASHPED